MFRAGVSVSCWFDIRCYIHILLYYILLYIYYYYTYYILYYTLLFSSSIFLSFSPSPLLPISSSSSVLLLPLILPSPLLSILIYLSIQSIRVGSSISLFIFCRFQTLRTCSNHLIHPNPFHNLSPPSSFKVYVSAFGYPYLYSRLINNLTPHVLSEWMVEV